MQENINSIIKTINKSNLTLSNELAIALTKDYLIEDSSNKIIEITNNFIITYQIKLDSIKKENTEYGILLTKTTEEMIQNLLEANGSNCLTYNAKASNNKIYYWFGTYTDHSEILFIHKFVTPRELTEEEKMLAESGKYIRIERDFNE